MWFDRKLQGNVHLEMVNMAEEWVGKVMWMPRVNGPVEVDRGRMVWELIGRPGVEHTTKCVVVRREKCMQKAGVDTDESG